MQRQTEATRCWPCDVRCHQQHTISSHRVTPPHAPSHLTSPRHPLRGTLSASSLPASCPHRLATSRAAPPGTRTRHSPRTPDGQPPQPLDMQVAVGQPRCRWQCPSFSSAPLAPPPHWASTRSSRAAPTTSTALGASTTLDVDVCVVGAGIIGLLVTRQLMQSSPDASVALLDAKQPCAGATGAGAWPGGCEPPGRCAGTCADTTQTHPRTPRSQAKATSG
jgi:hypothetical protein